MWWNDVFTGQPFVAIKKSISKSIFAFLRLPLLIMKYSLMMYGKSAICICDCEEHSGPLYRLPCLLYNYWTGQVPGTRYTDMIFVKIFTPADFWPIIFYPKSLTCDILHLGKDLLRSNIDHGGQKWVHRQSIEDFGMIEERVNMSLL